MTTNESLLATYEWYKEQGKDTGLLKKRFSEKYRTNVVHRKPKVRKQRVIKFSNDPLKSLTGNKKKKVEALLKDDGTNWSF